MTSRSRFILSVAVLLAVMVIASSVFLAISGSRGTEGAASMSATIAIGIVAVFSVVVVYMGKVRKSKAESMLGKEYFLGYEQIKDAIYSSDLPKARMKEISDEVLDMLLSAQKAGRKPGDVIGDPRVFIKMVMESSTKPSRLLTSGLINGVGTFILFILGITLVLWMEEPDAGYFGTAIDMSMVVLAALISFVVMPLTKVLIRRSMLAFGIPVAFGVLFVLGMEVLRASGGSAAMAFLDGGVRMVPSYLALAGYVLVLSLLRYLASQVR